MLLPATRVTSGWFQACPWCRSSCRRPVYLKMKIPGHHEANRWFDVMVQGVDGEMLVGKLVMIAPLEPPAVDSRWLAQGS